MREVADALWDGWTHIVEDWTECAQTHRQTDKSEKQYIRQFHSVHLADMNIRRNTANKKQNAKQREKKQIALSKYIWHNVILNSSIVIGT